MTWLGQLLCAVIGLLVGTWLYYKIKAVAIRLWRKTHPIKVTWYCVRPDGTNVRKVCRYRDIKDVDVRP